MNLWCFLSFCRGVLPSSCGHIRYEDCHRNTNPDYLDGPMCCQRAPSTGRGVILQPDNHHEYKLAHLLSQGLYPAITGGEQI